MIRLTNLFYNHEMESQFLVILWLIQILWLPLSPLLNSLESAMVKVVAVPVVSYLDQEILVTISIGDLASDEGIAKTKICQYCACTYLL